MIVQSAPAHAGVNAISLMTPRSFASQARAALAPLAKRLGARVDIQEDVAKVSAVGTGFRHHPGIAAKMFSTLAAHRINIHMITASDLRVSTIVDARHGETALRALHRAYGLAPRKRRSISPAQSHA